MCKSNPPGPSAQEKRLMNEQEAATRQQKEAAQKDRQKLSARDIANERASRGGGGTVPSTFGGSATPFGGFGQGSMFTPKGP